MRRIGIALSGGGVRAMAFHCGVLRWLAENGQLENITHLSSVSGGSLFVGLVFQFNDWRWPSDESYRSVVEPQIRELLTRTSLQKDALIRLLRPDNWRYLLSRANILAAVIEQRWGVTTSLSNLPAVPVWSINGTTAETGRRFRFKRTECGDYEIGYASASEFKVADAMAVSAAFPVGIGPFVIRTSDYTWRKRKSWSDPPESASTVAPDFSRLHLYDGGVYDNLGLEPLFDIGSRFLKNDVNTVIVSDAGAPLARISPGWALSPFRIKRIADIALDQTRALRIRSLIKFFQANPKNGMYLQLGAHAPSRIEQYSNVNQVAATSLLAETWLDVKEVGYAVREPTNLSRLTPEAYQRLERHGYETAKWNQQLFGSF